MLPAPLLYASPPDTLLQERGIDAVPEGDALQLDWQRNSRYSGYLLYRRGEGDKGFVSLRQLNGRDSTFVDQDNLALNKRYYYYLVGLDEDNNKSESSETVDYMLVPKAYNLGISWSPEVIFFWNIPEVAPDQYLLKLFDDFTNELVWMSRVRSGYGDLREQVQYNWDKKAKPAGLVSGRRYRWRIDVIGSATRSGSESQWDRFTAP